MSQNGVIHKEASQQVSAWCVTEMNIETENPE